MRYNQILLKLAKTDRNLIPRSKEKTIIISRFRAETKKRRGIQAEIQPYNQIQAKKLKKHFTSVSESVDARRDLIGRYKLTTQNTAANQFPTCTKRIRDNGDRRRRRNHNTRELRERERKE